MNWQHQQLYAGDVSGGVGPRETRRSWTTKDKPYVCSQPGCDKSYFYLHALRRHEKQKQHGCADGDTHSKENDHEDTDIYRQELSSPRRISGLLDRSGESAQGDVASTVAQQPQSLT